MTDRYVDLAVNSVTSFISANLPAALRLIETEKGLAADFLTDPIEYVNAAIPDDNRSPLIEVYDTDWIMDDQSLGLMTVTVAAQINLLSQDIDFVMMQRNMR